MKLSLSLFGILFITSTVFAADPKLLVQPRFEARLQLRASFQPGMAQADSAKLKAMMTAMRYDEDLVGEAGLAPRALDEISPPLFSDGQTVNLNPAVASLEFKSGDILVVRGRTTTSTLIAAISDSPSQFSHSFTIYLDPADNKMYAIEALIGQGVIVHPFDETLREGLSHGVLYRYKDATIANSAAKYDYEKAKAAIASGHPTPYASGLVLKSYDSVTCAEECRQGFDIVTNGAVKLPTNPSTMGANYPNTLKALGLPSVVLPVQWPADFDAEKDLTLIAESRDFAATLNFRIKDQIILSLLGWIEDGVVGHDLSPYLAAVKSKMGAPATPSSALENLTAFSQQADRVVNLLTAKILETNKDYVAKNGHNMSQDELKEYINSLRNLSDVQQILRRNGFETNSCKEFFI